jgi:hypothetical protein
MDVIFTHWLWIIGISHRSSTNGKRTSWNHQPTGWMCNPKKALSFCKQWRLTWRCKRGEVLQQHFTVMALNRCKWDCNSYILLLRAIAAVSPEVSHSTCKRMVNQTTWVWCLEGSKSGCCALVFVWKSGPLGFSWFSQLKHGIPAYPQTDPCITYVVPKYLHGIMQNQLFAGPKPVILGLGLLFHSWQTWQ